MQNCTGVDEALWKHLGLESQCFIAQLLPQLMDLVRASRKLPLGEEHAIRRGSREFLAASKELGQRSLGAVHRTLRFADPSGHESTSVEELANFNLLVDSIDSILERVDSHLHEAVEGPSTAEPAGSAARAGRAPAAGGAGHAGGKSSIAKPQVRWRQLIDNERTEFVPRLLVKHNQKVPLDARLVEAQCKGGFRARSGEGACSAIDVEAPGGEAVQEAGALLSHLSALGLDRRKEPPALPHPYEQELNTVTWADNFFMPKKPEYYPRMEDTPLVLVRTEGDLRQMIQEIKATCTGKEIAVDVEHHDFRTYRGFVCLVQISTRTKDFVVDPFDIFEQMHLLNEIFSDPSIVKVLHGADRDVLWLQRDFSVYLVNMFDTGLATRTLGLTGGFSLANLVLQVCDVKLDKKYQTADWRERPLPPEYVQYARCDTHYLLYCYDCLKNALLAFTGASGAMLLSRDADIQPTDEGLRALQTVLDKSTALCRLQYKESPLDAANVAMKLCERFSSKQRPLQSRQFSALQSLVQWRDRLARSLDESWNLVAPDPCLWRIALAMPTSSSRLRSTCNPLPLTLQAHAQEVVELVARSAAGDAPPTAPAAAPESAAPVARTQGPEAPAARRQAPAPAAAGQEWPARKNGTLLPVVHVTVGGGARTADGGLCAVLSTMPGLESSDEESAAPAPQPQRKLQEIRSAIRFATEAPKVDLKALAEAERAAEAARLAAEQNAAKAAKAAAPEDSEAPTQPTMLTRKRKRKAANPECLEDVAKVAVTDPYAAAVASDPYTLADAAPAAAGKPKKRKKKRAQEQTLVDPYL